MIIARLLRSYRGRRLFGRSSMQRERRAASLIEKISGSSRRRDGFPVMSSSVSGEPDGLSLHGLMSQGLNVVIAKRLLSIDGRHDHAIVNLDDKWEEKFNLMEATLKRQNEKVEALQVELKITKMALKATRGESSAWKRQAQFICTSVQSQSKEILSDVTEARNVSESCRAQVDKTLTLLKQEFEAIVAHIGQHDTSMAVVKLEMERRFHEIAETTQFVCTGFLEQQMEMMSIRNTLRGIDRQPRDISPLDQCEVSIFTDQKHSEPNKVNELERGWVQATEDTGTFDLKECISVLSIDSCDSLRQELESEMKTRIAGLTNMDEQREGEDGRHQLGETIGTTNQDMALRLAQAKQKFQSLKVRDLTRKEEPSEVNVEPRSQPKMTTGTSSDQRKSVAQENEVSLIVLDENKRTKGRNLDRTREFVNDRNEELSELGVDSNIPIGKKSDKKVTFVTENDEGEDELEYLVYMGEQAVSGDVLT